MITDARRLRNTLGAGFLYNPYSGITNNCSESVNANLKRLTEWKEKEVDNMILYVYYMQSKYVAELMKSFCGVGEMSLIKKI